MSEYEALVHAMQSGVAMKMNYDGKETEPKHLRVGVNSAMVDSAALAKLLIDKGIISHEEYVTAITEGMRAEKERYEAWLQARLGPGVTLG